MNHSMNSMNHNKRQLAQSPQNYIVHAQTTEVRKKIRPQTQHVFVFVLQRWSRAWAERDYQHNVFTNNGVEANNKVNFAIH